MTCSEFEYGDTSPDFCAKNENPSGLDSKALYDTFMDCACKSTCTAPCGASLCDGKMPSLACQECITDTDAGCGNPFFACTNDVP